MVATKPFEHYIYIKIALHMEYRNPRKIFIVDDDATATEALKNFLTQDIPHQVSVFSTGEECLKKLHEKPDIVILAYYLNSVQKDAANGLEILQAIRKFHPEVHVIMLSGQERYSTAFESIQKGAEQYVMKGEGAFEEIAELIQEFQ